MNIIRRFLIANPVWYEGEEMWVVTKLTWRLFEQWCYLKIIEAFRNCGLVLREWTDALRENLQSRFIIDFDRGLAFEGSLSASLRLRFRYEPWILGEKSAVEVGETLCRGSSTQVAWSPDVLIECLAKDAGIWRPVYGIVLDCKYTSRIRDDHWSAISKYLEIRSTHTKRQLVKQLCLIAPGEQVGIKSVDPAIRFEDAGPTCEPDEAVLLRLEVAPTTLAGEESASVSTVDPFQQFAQGTVSFLRRVFGSSA